MAASSSQSSVRIGIHCGAARHTAMDVIRLIIQNVTLTVESVRVTMRIAIALNAYPAADKRAATAPSDTKLDVDGLSIVRTPIKPTQMAAQRRQPTCSPSSGTESAVTMSGALRKIA